jgi:hypothetical protein
MKSPLITLTTLLLATAILNTGCTGRRVRTAYDVTPGNPSGTKLDWRYGAGDIRIQTAKVTRELMDRWFARTFYSPQDGRPRIIITAIDNRTDGYISTDMIRDIIEGVAIEDGRFSIVVGDVTDERELDRLMQKVTHDPKYSNSSRLQPQQAVAPQFLG